MTAREIQIEQGTWDYLQDKNLVLIFVANQMFSGSVQLSEIEYSVLEYTFYRLSKKIPTRSKRDRNMT